MSKKVNPRNHDCNSELRYDSLWNKAVLPLGTLLLCPTCKSVWMRTTEQYQGALVMLGYEPLVWTRLSKKERRLMDKIIQRAPSMKKL